MKRRALTKLIRVLFPDLFLRDVDKNRFCSKMIVAEILEQLQLLILEIRITGDKNLFQIIHDGRQNEFHRGTSFPMYSSKHRKSFSAVSRIGCDTVNFRTNTMKSSG